MKTRVPLVTVGAVVAIIAMATLAAPFASTSPDGLEKIAEDHGFIEHASASPTWRLALMPDYAAPSVAHEWLATGLAGLAGVVVVFGLTFLLAKVVTRRNRLRQSALDDQ